MFKKKISDKKVDKVEKMKANELESEISSEPETKRNPLIGYTLDEVKAFVREINPPCARGGCAHLLEFHILNVKGKLECHKCSCWEFLR